MLSTGPAFCHSTGVSSRKLALILNRKRRQLDCAKWFVSSKQAQGSPFFDAKAGYVFVDLAKLAIFSAGSLPSALSMRSFVLVTADATAPP